MRGVRAAVQHNSGRGRERRVLCTNDRNKTPLLLFLVHECDSETSNPLYQGKKARGSSRRGLKQRQLQQNRVSAYEVYTNAGLCSICAVRDKDVGPRVPGD